MPVPVRRLAVVDLPPWVGNGARIATWAAALTVVALPLADWGLSQARGGALVPWQDTAGLGLLVFAALSCLLSLTSWACNVPGLGGLDRGDLCFIHAAAVIGGGPIAYAVARAAGGTPRLTVPVAVFSPFVVGVLVGLIVLGVGSDRSRGLRPLGRLVQSGIVTFIVFLKVGFGALLGLGTLGMFEEALEARLPEGLTPALMTTATVLGAVVGGLVFAWTVSARESARLSGRL